MDLALEDGGGMVVALGGGVGRRCWGTVEDAAAALGGTGGRRTCDKGIGISIVKA
jgi:hypothetical protein